MSKKIDKFGEDNYFDVSNDTKELKLNDVKNETELDKELDNYYKSLEIAERIGDKAKIGDLYLEIGIVYHKKGEHDQAMAFCNKSLKIAEEIGDKSGISNSYHNIGAIYQDKGEYNQAMEFYNKSLDIKEKIGDKDGIAITYGQLGILYIELKDYEKAFDYTIKAYKIFKELESPNIKLTAENLLWLKNYINNEEFDKKLLDYGLDIEEIKIKSQIIKNIKINSINIQNIKTFNEISINLSDNINLFVGINGRGKSTVLQLLSLGLTGLSKSPYIYDWLKVVKSGKNEGAFSIKLSVENEEKNLSFKLDNKDMISSQSTDVFDDIKNNIFLAGYGTSRDVKREDVQDNKAFENIASIFGNPAYLKNIRDSVVYNKVKPNFDRIKSIINKFISLADDKYQFELKYFNEKGFYFTSPTDMKGITPLESMSDGFKSIFIILFDMLVRALERVIDIRNPENIKGIILIDEIDLHLHPTWQRNILPALNKTFPNIQFIITTHSPFVIQSMKTNDVFLFSVENNGVVVKKIEDMEGKPFGYEIEKIIKLISGKENELPEISKELFELLLQFKNSIKQNDKEQVLKLYSEIKQVIPKDSSFTNYIDIMQAGFMEEENQ
ncbi:MAG: hypothetical protein A2Y34_18820 [Spirochaetes bacterium GWC1_27_15]|nr:MAG: hypothetical protein A2Y34_18820 [Spirochaetes bacterium GWC1_27_15]